MGSYVLETAVHVDDFTKFIISHGETLEDLDLAYGPCDWSSVDLHNSPFLQADSLPRLKRFEGGSHMLKQMILKGISCLQNSLEKAVIWFEGPLESISMMVSFLDAALQPGRQPFTLDSLRELEFDMLAMDWNETSPLQRDTDGSLSCQMIERLARLCSRTLEVWHGSIYVQIEPAPLAQAFAHFEKLHTIWLRKDTIATYSPATYALILASWCSALRTVVISNGTDLHDGDFIISISREHIYPS